jgi:hypothetical protein
MTRPGLDQARTKARIPTRSETMEALMRADGGATAKTLAEAVGWQVHSVRGFISGTLKKREDIIVMAERVDGVTRYQVKNAPAAAGAND